MLCRSTNVALSLKSTVLRHTRWKNDGLVAQLGFFSALIQLFHQKFILSSSLHHPHGVIHLQIVHLSFQVL